MSAPRAVLGIFVGGSSSRMVGIPKGTLRAPDGRGTLVERALWLARECALDPVLVGDARGYSVDGLAILADEPTGIGPLGGLAGLLAYATNRDAIVLACDMPYVTPALLRRIATEHPAADVVAPRRGPTSPFEPLCARYATERVRPVLAAAITEGVRSFQALLARLDTRALVLDEAECRALDDWDQPDQVPLALRGAR